MLHKFRQLFTIFLGVCVGSCSSMRTVVQGERLTDNSKSIQVILHDDSMIKFYPDEYKVNSMMDSSYIEGLGRHRLSADGRETIFKGSININEIKEIRIVEPSTTTRILTPIVITGIGLVILLVLIPAVWGGGSTLY